MSCRRAVRRAGAEWRGQINRSFTICRYFLGSGNSNGERAMGWSNNIEITIERINHILSSAGSSKAIHALFGYRVAIREL